MRKTIYLCFILITTTLIFGCSNIKELSSVDATKKIFKDYDSDKKIGTTIFEENEDLIHIYYIVNSKYFNKVAKIYDKDNITSADEEEAEKLSELFLEEVSSEILDKIQKLYKNNNIDNLSMNIGIIHDDKIGGKAPGENITNEGIEYFLYLEFNKENVDATDWNNLNKGNLYEELCKFQINNK